MAVEKADGVRAELSLPSGYAFADAGDGTDLATDGFAMPPAKRQELREKRVVTVEQSL